MWLTYVLSLFLCYFIHVYVCACMHHHRGLLTGLGCDLSEHEVLVLGRCFSEREQSEADLGLMLAVVQDFLKKKRFDEIPDMARVFAHRDRHK